MLKDFTELCGHNGVEIKDYRAPSPWDEYEQAKKENPDAVVIQRVGDFFEIFGEQDTKIAHEVLDLTITKRTFENKSISTPMCGFPVFKTEEYTQKLLDAGYDVVAVTHEPGDKLQIRRIVSSVKGKMKIRLRLRPNKRSKGNCLRASYSPKSRAITVQIFA